MPYLFSELRHAGRIVRVPRTHHRCRKDKADKRCSSHTRHSTSPAVTAINNRQYDLFQRCEIYGIAHRLQPDLAILKMSVRNPKFVQCTRCKRNILQLQPVTPKLMAREAGMTAAACCLHGQRFMCVDTLRQPSEHSGGTERSGRCSAAHRSCTHARPPAATRLHKPAYLHTPAPSHQSH